MTIIIQSILPQSGAVLRAFTTQPTTARRRLINTLVGDAIDAGVWNKLDCFYVMAAHEAAGALVNWVAPGTRNLTPVDTPTFTTDRGYAGNGSSSYLDTGYQPDGALNYKQDDASFAVWQQASADSNNLMGTSSGTLRAHINPRNGSGVIVARINDGTSTAIAVGTGVGLTALNRSAADSKIIYKNGVDVDNTTTASTGLPASNILIGQSNTQFSTRITAAAWIGGSLTPTQQSDFYSILAAYMTAVGA